VVSHDVVACGTDSANTLAATFHYLCARGARKFVRAGLERSDLEQIAALGLIKASRRFDVARCTPFEAYAWRMILGELSHYVRDNQSHVRVPRAALELERRIAAARADFAARNGREASDAEIADAIGVVAARVSDAGRARRARCPIPLDDVPARGLVRDDAMTIDDRVAIGRAFGELDAIERRVIAGIYCVRLSQIELARHLGLSPKAISRVHLAALARMRASLA
jgi:RNA polymerase sigma-B factor